jgi:4-amino-4-deoxy-L-arabinose transferase-like glycosyltransferase
MTTARAALDRATLAFLGVLLIVTAFRIWSLFVDPMGLGADEAQYWLWSRTLDWGYFTKPPAVAWTIAATTSVFGDAEWAVRLGAPIAHVFAASFVFALARIMYGSWAGFWAGIDWLFLPGVFFSSAIISTDAILLPLWALALLAMWRLIVTRGWVWAIVLGLALGAGTLAKYAMLYFVLCSALAAWQLKPARTALAGGRGLVAALIALIVIAPNILWNVNHGFATARHTLANARLEGGHSFNFDEVLEFLLGQAGVIGPIVCLALIWLIWRANRRPTGMSDEDKFLLAYIAPPLIFVTIIAFLSRANANWAAVAYPAIVVWVSGSLFASKPGRRTLALSNGVNLAMGGALALIIAIMPATANHFKGVRTAQAWDQTALEIARRAVPQPGEAPFTAVMVDDRDTFFELSYYWRDARRAGTPLPPLRMWRLYADAYNFAEAVDPMQAGEGRRVLVVHLKPNFMPFVAGDFTVFRTVEHLRVPLGGDYNRELEISVGEGFAPVARDAAFLARVHRTREP